MTEPTQIDWARLAAFIDGEGNIRIRSRLEKSGAVRMYVEVTVSNCDARLPNWIKSLFGGQIGTDDRQREKPRSWRPCFRWATNSVNAARILNGCHEYFVIKRDQAEVALAFLATVKRVGGKRHSRETLEYRIALQQQLQNLHGWIGAKHGKSKAILALEVQTSKMPLETIKKRSVATVQ